PLTRPSTTSPYTTLFRSDLRTSTELAYSYLQSESEGVTSTTHEPRLRLVERLSHVDTGTLTYALRLTESESNGAGNSNTGAGNRDRKSTRLNSSHEWISY